MKTLDTIFFSSSLLVLCLLSACGGTPSASTSSSSAGSGTSTTVVPGGSEPAARFIFYENNFTHLNQFVTPVSTQYQCLGDLISSYYVNGPDYSGVGLTSGTPAPFPTSVVTDAFSPTYWPTFVKNVSVDVTQTYFDQTQAGVVQTDSCSYRSTSDVTTLPSFCADFDVAPAADPSPTVVPSPTVAPTPTPTPGGTATPSPTPGVTPTSTPYYNTGFYRTRDDWCTNQGSIVSTNVDTSKSYVGGINIDIDRTQLGANEDLLLMVTYLSLEPQTAGWPSAQYANDHTILTVSLVGTGQSLATLLGVKQPRQWTYYTEATPYLNKIATLEDPFGTLRTEQVYLPISQNALIDRVRIDRVRGSFFMYQMDLYRLGNRSN